MKTLVAVLLFLLPLPSEASLRDNASAANFANYVHAYPQPQLIETNSTALDARLKLLDEAPKGAHARIATFEFLNGESTRLLARHICLASSRGVSVELIVDSKMGDRAGIDDTFDTNEDSQVVEEVFQYMANCGAVIRIYNHIESYISVLGTRIPNIFTDPAKNGKEVSPIAVLIKADRLLDKIGDVASEELFRVGIQADIRPILKSLVRVALEMVQLDKSTKKAKDEFDSPRGYENSVAKLEELYLNIVQNPAWLAIPAAKLRVAIGRFITRLQADPELVGLYQEIRRYNRVQHRKLFILENGDDGCLILGGRNLADAYLADKEHSFIDADVLVCRHHSADASRAVDEAVASFENLLNDRSDGAPNGHNDLIVRTVPKAPDFIFENLIFPASLAPKGLHRGAYQGSLSSQDRTLLPERSWRDERAVFGESALSSGSNWHVLRSSWNPAEDQVRQELMRRIAAETKEIFIETAYAEFGPELRSALEAAMSRGVHVRLLTNSFFETDGLSKVIRALMANWVAAAHARFGERFTVLLTSYEGGHMTHLKHAAFACQNGVGGLPVRSYFLGSHNFHPRSGSSDKENSLSWEEPSNCDGLWTNSAVGSRVEFYRNLSEKLGVPVLVNYPDFYAELAAATNAKSGGSDEPERWTARALRRIIYVEGERGQHLKEEKRVQFILRLMDRGGLHDLLGLLL